MLVEKYWNVHLTMKSWKEGKYKLWLDKTNRVFIVRTLKAESTGLMKSLWYNLDTFYKLNPNENNSGYAMAFKLLEKNVTRIGETKWG